MNIYVGNIPRETSEVSIRDEFQKFGEVTNVSLIKDKYTNMLKGFGFVEMVTVEDAKKAIDELNGTTFMERAITVAEAKPQEPREKRGGFGGGGRGGYGGGGGRGGFGGGRSGQGSGRR